MQSLHEESNCLHTNMELPYWKEQLQDAPPILHLPTDYPRVSHIDYNEARLSFTFSTKLTKTLLLISQKNAIPLSNTLLTAFATLLYRYTQQSDIIITTPTTQNISASESIMNILLLRIKLDGNLTFNEMLQRVHKTYSMAHEYPGLPFDVMKQKIKAEGTPNSLSQLFFVFGTSSMKEAVVNRQLSQTELTLFIEEGPTGLQGQWLYNSSLFKEDTIKRMQKNFEVLLNAINARTEQQNIALLPMLCATERKLLLYDWNQTNAPFPNQCLHEMFEEQVQRTPHNIAVIYQQQKFTYQQLNYRANQLAQYLKSKGVHTEVLVGICIERSLDMIVGMLGILKAGGAYLPLDPNYPTQRLRYILDDAQISILLTHEQVLHKIPPNDIMLICLDREWDLIAQYSCQNIISEVTPNNLAYVIYTSGSTGQPKGTLIIHRGVVNYLYWCIKAYRAADGCGSPVNSSFAFDATITSLFSPLLVGKSVWLLPEEGEIEALSAALLSNCRFSLVKITPAHLDILSYLLSSHPDENQTNTYVIGGEALLQKSLLPWRVHAPGTRLINEYGPTETVVGCCVYEVTAQDLKYEDIPIGRPIHNTQLYILDQHLQPVPLGVAGELFIGGAGVARGYLNRPELTAEKFIPDPYSGKAGARLYKTGDLARWLPDGNIVFLGRMDDQVKIRGYRIELGEIEAALSQHPSIQQAAVIARQDVANVKRLVAYLVADPQPTTAELRTFLHQKLPDYMVPYYFVFLSVLPLTPNGKIDRAVLPAPDQRPDVQSTYLPPVDAVQAELASIFEKTLGIHPISRQDNFFELGGDSLQAARLFNYIRKRFAKQLPLATLLQAPTVEQLAVFLRQEKAQTISWSSLVPIQTKGTKSPLFCIHAGAGTVLFYHSLTRYLAADQPVYGLQAKGLDGNESPHTSIEQMATHYIGKMRTVQPRGPYYLAGYCMGSVLAFEMAQQLVAQGEQIALLANFNGVAPGYKDPSAAGQDEEDKAMLTDRTLNLEQHRFLQMSTKEKLIYPLKVLKSWIWSYRMQAGLRRWAYAYYLRQNRPLPEALGKHYFLETNAALVRAYQPRLYSNCMIIFYSPDIYPDPHLGWTALATSIHPYAIAGNHATRRQIMEEPFVQLTAQKLKAYLPA